MEKGQGSMISIQDRKSHLKFPDFHESGCEEAKGKRVKIDIRDLHLFFSKKATLFLIYLSILETTHTHTQFPLEKKIKK